MSRFLGGGLPPGGTVQGWVGERPPSPPGVFQESLAHERPVAWRSFWLASEGGDVARGTLADASSAFCSSASSALSCKRRTDPVAWGRCPVCMCDILTPLPPHTATTATERQVAPRCFAPVGFKIQTDLPGCSIWPAKYRAGTKRGTHTAGTGLAGVRLAMISAAGMPVPQLPPRRHLP